MCRTIARPIHIDAELHPLIVEDEPDIALGLEEDLTPSHRQTTLRMAAPHPALEWRAKGDCNEIFRSVSARASFRRAAAHSERGEFHVAGRRALRFGRLGVTILWQSPGDRLVVLVAGPRLRERQVRPNKRPMLH